MVDDGSPCWIGTKEAREHLNRPVPENPSLILATLYTEAQRPVLKALVAALQPGDDLLLACTPYEVGTAADIVGRERALGCCALPDESANGLTERFFMEPSL